MAENYERRWTAQRRAEKARLIQKYRPWRRACGPRTVEGKAVSCRNALKHGGCGAEFRRLNLLLRVQRRFVAAVLENRRAACGGSGYKHRMKLETLIRQIRADLAAAGVETPGLDARVLVRHITGLSEADMIAHPDAPVSGAHQAQIAAAVMRRRGGEPVSRILGEREFWGMSFKVTPDTLDPRADTEVLVEAALNALSQREREGTRVSGEGEGLNILDMGTGTGCILISLLKELPAARGVALDLSLDALRVARENARRHGVEGRISFLCGNWGDALCGDSFDLVVSNPPYIRESDIESLQKEVKNHDPILSLAGGKDGLAAYRVLFTATKRLLVTGGRGFFELGFGQLAEAMRLVDDSNLSPSRAHNDLAGIPRVLEITNGEN